MARPTTEALREKIEAYAAIPPDQKLPRNTRKLVDDLLDALERGDVRAAFHGGGKWQGIPWVKRGILLGFRIGKLVSFGQMNAQRVRDIGAHPFVDKDTYPARGFTPADGIRVVPGGSSIRRGTFIARGVVCMPPMYINVGAYVDEGTMVDSHALVGSCAQIGKRVHLSAAAQIGGVLEPVNAS